MSVEVKQKALEYVMDCMKKEFNGNLHETAKQVHEQTIKEGLSEELWEELGIKALSEHFRHSYLHEGRHHLKKAEDDGYILPHEKGSPVQKIKKDKTGYVQDDILYYEPLLETWMCLGDMRKDNVQAVAESYDKRVKANAFERDFLNKIASRLNKQQQVKDKFAFADIKNMRKKISEAMAV